MDEVMNSIDIRLLGFEPDDKKMAAATIQAFREIYYEVGCDDTDNEYIDLTASLTRIRSELAKHNLVQNIDCFMPARGRNSVITMNVDESMVWIADGNDVVRLADSRWSRFGSRRK